MSRLSTSRRLVATASATATGSAAGPSITARALATTAIRRAAPAHDDHHHHQHHSHGASEADTHETFFSPFWVTSFLLISGLALAYPYLPSTSKTPSSPSLNPDAAITTASDSNSAYLTKLISSYMPKSSIWSERNLKHLELTKENAETRLLFQEAERPRIWRMRYPS